MIITIDGPAASGKSTVARAVAEKLSIYYLNTGLLYRALGYILVDTYGYTSEQLANPDEQLVKSIFDTERFVYCYTEASKEHICIDHIDITGELKKPAVDRYASIVSANPMVRLFVLGYQRSFAQNASLVADGRDAGSRVFPNAEFKFFLTAPLDVRAARWQKDQERRGFDVSLNDSIEEVALRDERDSSRAHAPLVITEDAQIINTSDCTIEQVIDRILKHINAQD